MVEEPGRKVQRNSLTPELVARLVRAVCFKRKGLRGFRHDIGLIDIEEEYESTTSLHS